MKNNNIVITGVGLVCALGLEPNSIWKKLLLGKNGFTNIDEFESRGFGCHIAAQVKGLKTSSLNIHPRDARIMLKHSYMLMKSSQDALAQSEIEKTQVQREEIGFFAGMGMIDYEIDDLLSAVLRSKNRNGNINYDLFYSGGYQEIFPLWPLSMLNNISFCQVAINLGIKGENAVFSPHADSTIQAIIESVDTLSTKRAKIVLTGGVSENVSSLSLGRASHFRILNTSTKDEDHETVCSPFGSNRKGTILGEGCGMLTLELLSSAELRKAPILANISGYGSTFEKEEKDNCPTVRSITQSMEKAIAGAELHPSEIGLVIAHGDGTLQSDKNEAEAIHHVFSECIDKIFVYSSKGALGHTQAAAPAIDTVIGTYILNNGVIPALNKSFSKEKNIRFNILSGEPIKASIRRIMINAFSYEGQSATLILEAVK